MNQEKARLYAAQVQTNGLARGATLHINLTSARDIYSELVKELMGRP